VLERRREERKRRDREREEKSRAITGSYEKNGTQHSTLTNTLSTLFDP